MKNRMWIRIGTALAGFVLALGGLLMLAETFFHLPVSGGMSGLLEARTPAAVLLTLLLALALCALGVCCVWGLIPDKKHRTRGFVMQKGENGAIGVSVRSIEGLVQTCVKQYPEVSKAEISVVEKRDGMIILMDIEETAGVNIPLSVGSLQKQVRQYVSSCTGVDVHEVRVLVESSEGGAAPSAVTVAQPAAQAAIAAAAATAVVEAAPVIPAESPVQAESAEEPTIEDPAEEAEAAAEVAEEAPAEVLAEENETVEETVDESPVQPAAVPVAMPAMPEIIEVVDERPLHQRLFGTEEQPAFVPAPPELVIAPAEKDVEETPAEPAEEVEAAAEEAVLSSDAGDADAVAEVAQAIAFDGVDLYEVTAEEEPLEPAEAAAEDPEQP